MSQSQPPDDDGQNVFHQFLSSDSNLADVQNAYFNRDPKNELSRVLDRALGDTHRLCPDCGEFCETQVLALRDAILARAGHLAGRLSEGVQLYAKMRAFGLNENDPLLFQIYTTWNELATLFLASEPQESLSVDLDEAEEVDEEDGDEE